MNLCISCTEWRAYASRNQASIGSGDALAFEPASNHNLNKCYRQVSNISRTLIGNKIVDHSDVAGASPVGAAPTTFSFST